MNRAQQFGARSSRTRRALIVAGLSAFAVVLLAGVLGARGEASETDRTIRIATTMSWCRATGVEDSRTGSGHLTFVAKLVNDGDRARVAVITPVRYDDDGKRWPLRAMRVRVAAGHTSRPRTPALAYKASEHSVVGCALEINGHETPIDVR
jgi:hypothetical protein